MLTDCELWCILDSVNRKKSNLISAIGKQFTFRLWVPGLPARIEQQFPKLFVFGRSESVEVGWLAVKAAMRTPTRNIPLTKGYVARVDIQDADVVGQFNWYATLRGNRVYACTRLKSTRKVITMHRLITRAVFGRNIRWKNGNTLDNRRSNLYFPAQSTSTPVRKSA